MHRRRTLWLLFGVALLLRVGAMFAVNTPASAAGQSAWDWGWEPTALAGSLLDDSGYYGDPFGRTSGPSSWLTPFYTGFVAACFWLFDGVTPGAATAIFLVQAVLSAWVCVLLASFGRHLGAPRTGLLAGVLFALHPNAIWFAIGRAWDSTFVAAGLMAFLVLLLRAGRQPTLTRVAGAGAVYGVLVFLNPAPLALAPPVLLYLWLKSNDRRLLRLAVFLLTSFLVCLPWMLRNVTVLDSFSLRSNFGVELRVGNNDDVEGRFAFHYHPSSNDEQFARYVTLGEAHYAAAVRDEALEWIQQNPGAFLQLSLRRAGLFWFGQIPSEDVRAEKGMTAANDPKAWVKWLASALVGALSLLSFFWYLLRGPRTAETILLLGSVAFFPAVYYLTHVSERYRFPMEALLVFLIAWSLDGLLLHRQARQSLARSQD